MKLAEILFFSLNCFMIISIAVF